ncbi:MAG TPA: septation protein IspZ, partial [Steroidobacteraceae bacterium]|nr:septation protein IspZ [Steroidobacteraceae bacterium]
LLAAGLLGGGLFSDKPVVQRLLDSTLPLSPDAWRTLNTIWAVGFILIGAINLYVVYNFDLETWVDFKVYGLTGLTLLFGLAQSFWLVRKLPPEEIEKATVDSKGENK